MPEASGLDAFLALLKCSFCKTVLLSRLFFPETSLFKTVIWGWKCGQEWNRVGRGGVNGKGKAGWEVNERGFCPIFKIFKSLVLQDLTFPAAVPLDCL